MHVEESVRIQEVSARFANSRSQCMYRFQLVKQNGGWKINGITQQVLWNEGTASRQKGSQQRNRAWSLN
jgi:hypothetical protein